jgi:hypothetical protein
MEARDELLTEVCRDELSLVSMEKYGAMVWKCTQYEFESIFVIVMLVLRDG